MRLKPIIFLTAVLSFFRFADSARAQLPYREDAVVVKGAQLSSLTGKELGSFSLMRWRGGKLEPIPFQIDEKTKEGAFVYPNGQKKNPQAGNGKLDAQDELVLMAWDAGEFAPASFPWPESAESGAQIIITDPVRNNKAVVYLFSFPSPPPISKGDYAQHLVEEGRNFVKTDHYYFGEPIAKGFFDRFHLVGPDGKIGPNLVDRIKGRGHITTMAGLVNLLRGENDTPADLMAWIDGPVRVVHRMEGGLELPLGIKVKLAGGSDNVFYRNYLYTPIFFSLPAGAASLLKGSYMIYTIDYNNKFKGSYYFDPVNKTPTVIDGKMDAQEKALNLESIHNWYAVGGDQGNLVERMIVPAQWKDYVRITTFYVDDDQEPDPPEDEPGRHQFGFKLGGLFEAPAGKYQYYLYYMVPDQKVTRENVSAWLDLLDHPLKIQSQPLSKN